MVVCISAFRLLFLFFYFFLGSLTRGLLILFILPKKLSSWRYCFFLLFCLNSALFISSLIIFLLLLSLGFVCSFSNSFRWCVRFFIWYLPVFFFFGRRTLSLWTSLLGLLLLPSVDFVWLCFHCHFSQDILKFPLISTLTHCFILTILKCASSTFMMLYDN